MSNYSLVINGMNLGQHKDKNDLIAALFANADIAPAETAAERHERKMQALDAHVSSTVSKIERAESAVIATELTPEIVYPAKKY